MGIRTVLADDVFRLWQGGLKSLAVPSEKAADHSAASPCRGRDRQQELDPRLGTLEECRPLSRASAKWTATGLAAQPGLD